MIKEIVIINPGFIFRRPGAKKGQASGNLLQRCYGQYGCFSINEPFVSVYRPINLFPLPPEMLNVIFFLKTRRNPDSYQKLIAWEKASFSQANFNSSLDLKIIIHGYLEHGYQPWIKVEN